MQLNFQCKFTFLNVLSWIFFSATLINHGRFVLNKQKYTYKNIKLLYPVVVGSAGLVNSSFSMYIGIID